MLLAMICTSLPWQNNILFTLLGKDMQFHQFAVFDATFHESIFGGVEFEINIPIPRPGRREQQFVTDRLESNEAATVMNMVLFTMTELATWNRTAQELIDRSNSPWDDPARRPSHADRRNFLRRSKLAIELYAALNAQTITKKLNPLSKDCYNSLDKLGKGSL